MDPKKCFTYLCDNLPQWITKLDELSTRAQEVHSEFSRVTITSPGKKRSGSVESIRPEDRAGRTQERTLDQSSRRPQGQPQSPRKLTDVAGLLGNKQGRRQKRTTPSMHSGSASGPGKHRTRSIVIIRYDSIIQEGFEQLVRNIGGARNNLRKAKTTASFNARMTSLGMDTFGASGSIGGMLSPKTKSKLSDPRDANKLAAFDQADKYLDVAQNLCEVGAHQFLREGECNEELESTRAHLEDCLTTAREELARIVAEDERTKELLEEVFDDLNSGAWEDKVESNQRADGFATGLIEVDDVSEKSISIDLSSFRRTRQVAG